MTENKKLFIHLLLIFKVLVYRNRKRNIHDLDILIDKIRKIKAIVKRLVVNDTKKLNNFDKKWKKKNKTKQENKNNFLKKTAYNHEPHRIMLLSFWVRKGISFVYIYRNRHIFFLFLLFTYLLFLTNFTILFSVLFNM